MSSSDRERWNQRYAAVGENLPAAAGLLVEWCSPPATGKASALDVACGRGRHAMHLARLGYSVDAVDISDVALAELETRARAGRLPIVCLQRDLDTATFPPGQYAIIAMIRYRDTALLRRLTSSLTPGGRIVVETHLVAPARVAGPRNPAFLVRPGELADAADGLEILFLREGLVERPGKEPEALAQMVARRPC